MLEGWQQRLEAVFDRASWWSVRWVVDAVRFRPLHLDLALACAVGDAEAPSPVARWLVAFRTQPEVVGLARLPHTMLRRVASGLGPTGSTVLRWWLGVVAGIADRAVGSTLERLVVAAPHPSLLVPHVHQVAILAIDMRGFSQLTRELDDSQYLADLISEYLTCLTTIVEGDRGVIFQYTGDGLLAAFLPEIAGVEMGPLLERLTRRMTPALHVAFERLRARWEDDWVTRGVPRAPIGLGIGLSVGAATIGFLGPIGKKQLSVIGEPVNTAAYLCAQASAGAVLIDRVSFETAGIAPPEARTTRLRSKKPHQRIDVICLRGRTRTGWAGLMAWE